MGTIAVVLLDATDGVIYFGLTAHRNPIQVLQYIASGAFGTASFDGGLATAFAGLVFHILISLVAVIVFAALYLRSRTVRDHAIAAGLVYGGIVWSFMNLVVLPASAVAPSALTPLAVVHGLVGHALFVGLPAALAMRRYLRAETGPQRGYASGVDVLDEFDGRTA
jgi:uncharacterized membrane protein YagU involved in acid resistance